MQHATRSASGARHSFSEAFAWAACAWIPCALLAPAALAQDASEPVTPAAHAQGASAPVAPASPPTATDPAQFEMRVRSLLTSAWLADAYALARDPDVSGKGYESALDIALQCTQLTPTSRSAWEASLIFADQVADGSPEVALAARHDALAQLMKLDPTDDVIRLARVNAAIEAHPTAEARVRAFEQVLDPKNRAGIGDAVAARLAYQLASLESRIGNSELFARWLGESVKADPSYPLATQAAAGFFRMRVNDPAADIELLSMAVEANPRDQTTLGALITVLLDGGAFRGAERVTRIALAVAEADRRVETVYALTGDLATSLWGAGRREDAVRELEVRLSRLTAEYRQMIAAVDPTITLERLNREFPPVPTSIAIAALSLQRGRLEQTAYDDLMRRATLGFDAAVLRAKNAGASEGAIGEIQVQKATLMLLFARDVTEVGPLLEGAASAGSLGGAARARFDAMLQWRQGKTSEALAALESIRAGDALARYAYAGALLDAKRTQEAAREYQGLAQELVGTPLGLLALDRLAETLAQKQLLTSQLSPALAARGAALEQALTEQLSPVVDDIATNPLRALSITATASATTIGPYEPLHFKLMIRNISRLPMAIGTSAPIAARLSMRSSAPRAGDTDSGEVPPQPISIDRRLRLAPSEQLEIDIDVANTDLGRMLALDPVNTHLVTASIISNPIETQLGPTPGFMGTVTTTPPISCKGVDATPEWVAAARKRIALAGSVDGLIDLALLAHLASVTEQLPESVRGDSSAIWNELAAAWKALPELAQAWVVATLPKETPPMAPLLDAVRGSSSPAVLTSWLIGRVTDPLDPMIDVARRTGDPKLSRLADASSWVANRRNKRAIDDSGGGARSGGAGSGAGSGGSPAPPASSGGGRP